MQKKQINVSFSHNTELRLKQIAEEQHRSVSNLIGSIIENYLINKEQEYE